MYLLSLEDHLVLETSSCMKLRYALVVAYLAVDVLMFSTHGVTYSQVCGRMIGYQVGNTDAFGPYSNNRLEIWLDNYNEQNIEKSGQKKGFAGKKKGEKKQNRLSLNHMVAQPLIVLLLYSVQH